MSSHRETYTAMCSMMCLTMLYHHSDNDHVSSAFSRRPPGTRTWQRGPLPCLREEVGHDRLAPGATRPRSRRPCSRPGASARVERVVEVSGLRVDAGAERFTDQVIPLAALARPCPVTRDKHVRSRPAGGSDASGTSLLGLHAAALILKTKHSTQPLLRL